MPKQSDESGPSARQQRVARVARKLGFAGKTEYRHVFSQSGGAQYCRGKHTAADILLVYAEAFDRDADPGDFSLEAIIAHECGHQMLVRHKRIASRVAGRITDASEEILASLLGAMISQDQSDRSALMAKAAVELMAHGVEPTDAIRRLDELWDLMEALI